VTSTNWGNLGELLLKEWPNIKIGVLLITENFECPLPELYYIDPGNLCNLKCPFCPTGIGNNNLTKGLMSRETFDLVFDQIKSHAKIICLYNWGEPFLNKNILYMASECARYGIRSQIDSNLSVRDFSDEEADAIVKSGLSQIYASIDGASQETYGKYRVRGNFERALNNMRQIVLAKKRLSSRTPDIGWNFLINKFNEHEIDTAKEMAQEIGVHIEFKLMSCWDSNWLSSYHLQPTDIAGGQPRESEIKKQEQPPLPLPVDQLELHSRLYDWCTQPFSFMVINWDGIVMPCCTVYGDEYGLGDLTKNYVEDVWNNEKLRSCRKFLYNFGPIQDTGSVCETLPCPVETKHL
jgi:radical SAM protein with 4Fe4S-binding SPASM domain